MRAEFADHRFPLVQPDADGECRHVPGPPIGVQFAERQAHRDGGVDRPDGILDQIFLPRVVAKAAPDRHHRVPDELVDGAIALKDDGHHALEVLVELGHHFLGAEDFAQARIASDVREKHHHRPVRAFADRVIKLRALDDLLCHVRRVETHHRSLQRELLPPFEQKVVAPAEEADQPEGQERRGDVHDQSCVVKKQHLQDHAESEPAEHRQRDCHRPPAPAHQSPAQDRCGGDQHDAGPDRQQPEVFARLGGGVHLGVDAHSGHVAHRRRVKVLEHPRHGSQEHRLSFEKPAPAVIVLPHHRRKHLVQRHRHIFRRVPEAHENRALSLRKPVIPSLLPEGRRRERMQQ